MTTTSPSPSPSSLAATPPEISILRWPAEAASRARLAELRQPRLLVVDLDAEPPELVDELEDWVRAPADPIDLVARTRNLTQRATELSRRPALDEDGLLRVGDRWVAIPDFQIGVVELLVRRFGRLVRLEELTEAYVRSGGSGKEASIKTVIARLGTRLSQVGLQLRKVRGRGVVLTAPLPC